MYAQPDPTAVWKYTAEQFSSNNMSWTVWSYKSIKAGMPGVIDSWGVYGPPGPIPPRPNIQTDSAEAIRKNWSGWGTSTTFAINPVLQHGLAMPFAVPDSYTAAAGVPLTVNSNEGVLANDTDVNLGQPGIQLTARLSARPAHGKLTLLPNGSFTSIPVAGFTGTDTFRYRTFDGHLDSTGIATMSIHVR